MFILVASTNNPRNTKSPSLAPCFLVLVGISLLMQRWRSQEASASVRHEALLREGVRS